MSVKPGQLQLDRQWNEDPKPFVWHKTSGEILNSISRYCAEIIQTTPTNE